jgi:hypothetical protein
MIPQHLHNVLLGLGEVPRRSRGEVAVLAAETVREAIIAVVDVPVRVAEVYLYEEKERGGAR